VSIEQDNERLSEISSRISELHQERRVAENRVYDLTDRQARLQSEYNIVLTRVREQAQRTAQELLEEHLDERQLQQYQDTGHFTVEGNYSGTTYYLRAGNNPWTDDGPGYCIAPGIEVPEGDRLLAFKVLLETDEEQFLSVTGTEG
jgi:hypothetical protein